MKRVLLQLSLMVVLSGAYLNNTYSQDKLGQALASIKEYVKEVQVDKTTYKQSIDILDESKGKLSLTSVMVDDKGKSSTDRYEFYVSDLDKNTILRKTSGKKLLISLTVINNQKFIKHFKEDKLDSYANNLEILLSGADEAQELADLFKSTIPLVVSGAKEWNSNTDALNWLKSNISAISSGPATVEQSFTFGERKDYLAAFTVKKTDQKGVSVEEKYEFGLLDINPTKLTVEVSGTQLSASVETKGNDPFIKFTKNNELQSFARDFEIIAEDIDQARNIIAAFSAAIEKSKQVFPDFATLQKSLDFISKNTGELSIDKKTVIQKIEFVTDNGTKSVFTSSAPDQKGKVIEEHYEFYLCDIDANSLTFKVSGKKISIVPVSKNKTKFIKYFKDNTVQDFQNEVAILTGDIETAREMAEAFKAAIKGSEVQPASWKSIDEAVKYLTGTVTGETVGPDIYKLGLSAVSAEPLCVRYAVDKTDAKGVTANQAIEFYPYMLDPASAKITSGGKYLNVELSVNGKKSFVRAFKDGKQQSYSEGIEIMAFDASQAQKISDAFKYLAVNSKPKELTWGDKQSVAKFIMDNVGDIKYEAKDVKQKAELINNDPCRISLTISSSDDKGKTTDEIFEFTLGDMNKQLVDLRVSGKTVEVLIPCKNKEKLVKAYKNGEQQAWGSEVKIGVDDIEKAKNLAEAFKNAIGKCGK